MTNINSYSQKVLEHFRHPHNYGRIKNASGTGEVGNIVCGDVMHLYIKIVKNKNQGEIIQNIKFETYGCAAAIATSSVITDLVKGKPVSFALNITKDDVVKSLEGLPPIKIHCSLLAVDALKEALFDHFVKMKYQIPPELQNAHDKNIKEKGIIEKRYAPWVKAQREKITS